MSAAVSSGGDAPPLTVRVGGSAAAYDVVSCGLADLARDPELCRRMGEAGRSRILERYAVDRLIGDVDELYRTLLETKGLGTLLPPR